MMLLIPEIFFILEMCFFYPFKIPKIPENSWILGEVEALPPGQTKIVPRAPAYG